MKKSNFFSKSCSLMQLTSWRRPGNQAEFSIFSDFCSSSNSALSSRLQENQEKNVLSQMRLKVTRKAIKQEVVQERAPDMIPALLKTLATNHKIKPYQSEVNTRKRSAVFIMSHMNWRSSSRLAISSGFGQLLLGILGFLHNLVHALPRQVVRICDLAEGHPLAAHRENLRISGRIGRRPWLQRAPAPAAEAFERPLLVRGNQALLVALSYVAYPGAQPDLDIIKNLDMKSRDSGVALSIRELLESFYILIESGVVVHARTL